MATLITPPRRRGVEYLDAPGVDPRLVRRSLADVALANALFGGTRAVLLEIEALLPELASGATLLDVGSGVGDIAARARELARRKGIDLSLVTIDMAETLAVASRARTGNAVRGDATALPVRGSIGGRRHVLADASPFRRRSGGVGAPRARPRGPAYA